MNATIQMIDGLIADRFAITAMETNHDVYDKRLTLVPPRQYFDKVPHCIYFYYVRIDTDGKVRVDHYLYVKRNGGGMSEEIPYADVPGRVFDLAVNGRPSTWPKDPAKLASNNFDYIPWKYRSYIAIFVDEANWAFQRRANGKAAVVFDPVLGHPNNSFFDAQDLVLDMPNSSTGETDKRSAIFFVDHMKRNSDGADLYEGEEQTFKFDMWLTATFANASTIGMTVNFDPGGTNQGPPEDPP